MTRDACGGDRGLQPERTRLAWRRTTLSCTVVAVLAVKAALRDDRGPLALTVCALCLGLWLAFVATAHRRVQALAAATPLRIARRLTATAVLCTVGLALCAVAVVV